MGEDLVIRVGAIALDLASRQLRVADRTTLLTQKEARLLAYLVSRAGEAVERETIFRDVWGYDLDCNTNSLDVYICRLRRYLEEDPTQPRYLQTIRGYGYRFCDPAVLNDSFDS